MKRNLNETFDQTAQAIRQSEPNATQLDAAADNAWARIAQEDVSAAAPVAIPESIRGCSDYQALIPAYLGGQLAQARTMLLEDHTRECLPCRRALREARNGNQAVKVAPAESPTRQLARSFWPSLQLPPMRWAMAAAAVLVLGLASWPFAQRFMHSVGTLSAIVEASNGSVFRVTANATEPLAAGTQLKQGERLRTAKEAGAVVKLSDGSRIETRERSEFSINETLDGTTINLERGQVIVQAAKQNGGRKLFVATPDSMVAVKGTIFAVNSGTKGARVSVVEGEVEFNHDGKKAMLHSGEQAVTHESIVPVRVRDEVAWSRDAQRYGQLLDSVKRDIDARVAMPGNRYSTRLLDLMPEGTAVYVALPNLSTTLAQAQQILDENIQQNPELREWYAREKADNGKGHDIHAVLNKLVSFGNQLGAEIAIGVQFDTTPDKNSHVLALAEINDANAFRAAAETQLAELNAESKEKLPVQFVDDPFKVNSIKGDERLMLWLHDGLLAASTDAASLQRAATALKGNASGFNASAFHARLADVYREGAGFLVAADLEKFIGSALTAKTQDTKNNEAAALSSLGVNGLKHFIAEMKESNGKTTNRALVTYEPNQQHGVTSWLAAPGPMGALQFISPDANAVAAFVVESPTALFDDLMNALKTADPQGWQQFQDLQAQHGINLREDFAAALGGEFAAALDGPVLPTPAWKVVAEVNDAAKLQASLERAVTELNKLAAQHNHPGLLWERADVGGKTYYRLKATSTTGGGVGEVNYAYAYGYLVAAPSRALVENAIKYRESGYTILQSSKFQAALPEDKQANFSAMIYQNLDSVLSPLAKQAERLGANKGEGHAPEMLRKLFGTKAGLAYAYALGDRMVFSLNTEDGGALLTPSSLLGLSGAGPASFLRGVK